MSSQDLLAFQLGVIVATSSQNWRLRDRCRRWASSCATIYSSTLRGALLEPVLQFAGDKLVRIFAGPVWQINDEPVAADAG